VRKERVHKYLFDLILGHTVKVWIFLIRRSKFCEPTRRILKFVPGGRQHLKLFFVDIGNSIKQRIYLTPVLLHPKSSHFSYTSPKENNP